MSQTWNNQSPVAQPGVFRKMKSKLTPDMDKLKVHLRQLRVSRTTTADVDELTNDDEPGPPIHRLPNEILGEIIMYATDGSVDICIPKSDAWIMERVCRRWRCVTLALPHLWRTIDVSLGALADYKSGIPLKVLKKLLILCTQRAGGRPLRLKLMDICPQDIFNTALRLVSVYSHQWEALYVSISMIKEPPRFRGGISQLKTLELTGKYRGSSPLLESFGNGEHLTTLRLVHVPQPFLTLRIQWENIQELSLTRCDFSTGEFVQLVSHIPNIVTFASSWSNKIMDTGNPLLPKPLVRRRMQRLELELWHYELGPLMQHFILPALTDLSLFLVARRPDHRTPQPPDDPVVDLIQRSSCSLLKLTVNNMEASTIYDILEASPSVKTLELDLVQDAPFILEYLVQPDVLVPALECLSVSLKVDQGVRCIGPLLALIQARVLMGGVLKQVTITMRESKGVHAFRQLLYPLKDTGVKINIIDHLKD